MLTFCSDCFKSRIFILLLYMDRNGLGKTVKLAEFLSCCPLPWQLTDQASTALGSSVARVVPLPEQLCWRLFQGSRWNSGVLNCIRNESWLWVTQKVPSRKRKVIRTKETYYHNSAGGSVGTRPQRGNASRKWTAVGIPACSCFSVLHSLFLSSSPVGT